MGSGGQRQSRLRHLRALETRGNVEVFGWGSSDLDVTDRLGTLDAAAEARPSVVVLAAAKVGGIVANRDSPVEFLTDKVRIQPNAMKAAHAAGVELLLFFGSSGSYPRQAAQQVTPDLLMTGPLRAIDDAHALAKPVGITRTRAHRRQRGRQRIPRLPTNLDGIRENYDTDTSHVLPAFVGRSHEDVRLRWPVRRR